MLFQNTVSSVCYPSSCSIVLYYCAMVQLLADWQISLLAIMPLFALATRRICHKYDTRCYFNVRSKADISQLNLLHGTKNYKVEKTEKLKSKKQICSEVSVNNPGNPWSQSGRRKQRLRWKSCTRYFLEIWGRHFGLDLEGGDLRIKQKCPLKLPRVCRLTVMLN